MDIKFTCFRIVRKKCVKLSIAKRVWSAVVAKVLCCKGSYCGARSSVDVVMALEAFDCSEVVFWLQGTWQFCCSAC